ncbi:glycoside hydrolase family 92 protein [Flammeovirga sp. MY04]|uniref:GH92 family glycosyl hydrolase n=1 Tax=Flammeovirga sp. MY04 TaxID=1191459 RepID=UPI0008063A4F|nr:GH92 family glycosyl hydrolase [Flammeovirga sp. MY04]ANQ51963.1 glycoside hydrolase family 92 protein [Flammeovirga sp. MY04]
MKQYILFFSLITLWACDQPTSRINGADYVDVFVGTGEHGHTFPGATLPNGMVQLSPDTRKYGWDACSGFHDSDSTLLGFSHRHLSGTGIGDQGDFLITPFIDSLSLPIGFKKSSQNAKAGYYEVLLDNGIHAHLSTTERVGIHHYTKKTSGNLGIHLEVSSLLQGGWSIESGYKIINDSTIEGYHHSLGWAYSNKVYFYAKFSSPFDLQNLELEQAKGKKEDLHLELNFGDIDQLDIAFALSPTSTEGAKKNFNAEFTGFDYQSYMQKSIARWDTIFDKIQIETEDINVLKNFYTSLYHTYIHPSINQDVDGQYVTMDKQLKHSDHQNYTIYSMWDTYRAVHPLLTIIDPELTEEFIENIITKGEEINVLPKWPLASNITGTMIGYPATAILSDAFAKGYGSKDQLRRALALSLMSANYNPELIEHHIESRKNRLMALDQYYIDSIGYSPADICKGSVSYGLEVAYYDWCIAQMADLLDEKAIANEFYHRSKRYAHYFDPQTKFMRPKNLDGSWRSNFDPKHSQHENGAYTEGNAWQWSWFVPHDPQGLVQLMGGKQAFEHKLDALFSMDSEITGEHASADITGLIGQYAHGNEPSHHITYLYNEIGEMDKGRVILDSIMNHYYAPTPEGICGNEDVGQLSAWYILNALGFYQLAPGDPTFTIGRPMINSAIIKINGGDFKVRIHNNKKSNKKVAKAMLDNKKLEDNTFQFSQIQPGSTLEIWMKN